MIIPAASGARVDVDAAIQSASDGDTVTIPAGTWPWTETLKIAERAITVQGAGIDQTVIVDNVPKPANGRPPGHLLIWDTIDTALTRLTGLTVQGGDGPRDAFNKSMVVIGGESKKWRIDDVRIVQTQTSALVVQGWTYGVVDHCIVDLVSYPIAFYVHHPLWNGAEDGDGSWADDLTLGSERAVFIEDCVFNGNGAQQQWAVDGWAGGRVVFRHNRLLDAKITNHGSDSGGRNRGARSFEIYANEIANTGTDLWNDALAFRSGNGVIFDNIVEGRFGKLGAFHYYRDFRSFATWKQCDGTTPYDLNDNVVYDTGTHTGGNNSVLLVDAGKAWTLNQWYAYSVHNLTRGGASVILSNAATSIAVKGIGQYKLPKWSTGDQYRILRATIGFDQTGRGKGDLLTGTPPMPAAWPNQIPEPVFIWGNTLNGVPIGMISTSPMIQEGRDFYNDQQKPGYVPFTYPHPLTVPPVNWTPVSVEAQVNTAGDALRFRAADGRCWGPLTRIEQP